jgi:hypothetical protein
MTTSVSTVDLSPLEIEKLEALEEELPPVSVRLFSGTDAADGIVFIRSFTQGQMRLRGLRVLTIFWAIAAVTIFIPILHFILVPGFLIGGIVASAAARRQKSIVAGGKGSCPKCGVGFLLVKSADRWPLGEVCPKCGAQIRIEKRGV